MADIKSILDKVIKLRTLADQTTNANEAANAAGQAERLIQEYSLSEAELQAKDNSVGKAVIEGAVLYSSGRKVPYKSSLAIQLSEHYGVYLYNDITYSDSGRQVSNYRMCGRESDIGLLHYNYCYFIFEIERLADLNCSKQRGVSVEKLSYSAGCVAGIMERLRAEKRAMQNQATSSALAILDNKHKEAKAFACGKVAGLARNVERQEKLIAKGKGIRYSHSQTDYGAYTRGKEAGASIHANAGLNGSGGNRLLGS